MKQDRFFGLPRNRRLENGEPDGQESIEGFTTNPLGDAVTPAQILVYQAAYRQAQKEAQKSAWPGAECWN